MSPGRRRPPEKRQDSLRFRNLVRELEASLLQKCPAAEAQLLLKPFEALAAVANGFHAKPLRRFLQSVDRYQVLGPGLDAVRLYEADREIAGKLDPASGQIAFAPLEDPHVDDLLDDLAELVLTMGGRVLVVPAERMPSTTGLAATYRC